MIFFLLSLSALVCIYSSDRGGAKKVSRLCALSGCGNLKTERELNEKQVLACITRLAATTTTDESPQSSAPPSQHVAPAQLHSDDATQRSEQQQQQQQQRRRPVTPVLRTPPPEACRSRRKAEVAYRLVVVTLRLPPQPPPQPSPQPQPPPQPQPAPAPASTRRFEGNIRGGGPTTNLSSLSTAETALALWNRMLRRS